MLLISNAEITDTVYNAIKCGIYCLALVEHRVVFLNESQLVSFCPCVWEFNVISGSQRIDVLSRMGGMIAAHWPHLLAAQGYCLPTSSENVQPTFDWNWNEEIQEHVIWLQGWSAGSTQSHRRSGIGNIRYACIAGGYSIGLETSIISPQLEWENKPRWI